MHLPFTPNHIQLISACYPPSTALITSGSIPSSQELSRLTYYAANKSGKLNKLGIEMERRIANESRKAQAGNIRLRASLLISLQILRALATECRRDISLLTASILSSVATTLRSMSSDLEVSAKAATLFTTWTTYTDGRLVGADAGATNDYSVILETFSQMSVVDTKDSDHEFRNRKRLVGLAALTGTTTSEALYSSSIFRQQVPIIVSALLFNICDVDMSTLEEESSRVKIEPSSPYLSEFRARPVHERRAASIHIHRDGERGPSTSDLIDTCLRALHSLFAQSTGSHITHVIHAVLESLNQRKRWDKRCHCCWLATKMTEWSPYQYRYAVPTKLIERLVEEQDASSVTALHTSLTAMITAVFTSPIHLINLSTSDTISNLLTLILRRVATTPDDVLLPSLAECIASLGTHIYYSDQIQDLSLEIISRLLNVDTNGVPGREEDKSRDSRVVAIRYLLLGLVGLMLAPRKHESAKDTDGTSAGFPQPSGSLLTETAAEKVARTSKRARVSPETWQDTLHLLCDDEFAIRSDYACALKLFLRSEMAERNETLDVDGVRRFQHITKEFGQKFGDFMNTTSSESSRTLHAIHVFIFGLAVATALSTSPTPASTSDLSSVPSVTDRDSPLGRPSTSISINMRTRRQSAAKKLLLGLPPKWSTAQSPEATGSDYRNVYDLLTAIHESIPLRGLVLGVPVLVALDHYTRGVDDIHGLKGHVLALREVLARIWLTIAQVWECEALADLVNRKLLSLPRTTISPPSAEGDARKGKFLTSSQPEPMPETDEIWSGVDTSAAIDALLTSREVFEAVGFSTSALKELWRAPWSPQVAWKNSIEPQPVHDLLRGDVTAGGTRLHPALMLSDNMSLQSLTRSSRGVGVSDLREALEGRSSMSNPNLVARTPSISTLDHISAHNPGDSQYRLRPTRSRPEKQKLRGNPNEVREVLNKLRIGKPSVGSSTLLKASFPTLQNPEARTKSSTAPPYTS